MYYCLHIIIAFEIPLNHEQIMHVVKEFKILSGTSLRMEVMEMDARIAVAENRDA